ncbi:NHL repeat-containing protein [Anaeromyxobacter paludicola]|uniref:PKD domain-containing protein n=1 Tax=Anaeromyxobacter paludicola TaxID=2918171 RepID=A0ABN6NA28_9BACT|nr:NHL repeat-containing protein [Anaeromyxobacter paludicola]BDG08850.1 hypothetical protein AMPC_19630 [Anaeromyxobacter paludicola]
MRRDSRAGLVLALFGLAAPASAAAWGCSTTQPPAVTVSADASSAIAGSTVVVSTSATSQTALKWFAAVVPAGQGTLLGGAPVGDGSIEVAFATGATSAAGTASWVLPATPGTYAIKITAVNCAGAATASAQVSAVSEQTVLPVIDAVEAGAKTVLAGKSVALTATAHDPAGGAVTYAWSASAGAFSSDTASSTTWTAPGAGGRSTLTLTVSNGQATATSSLSIAVELGEFQGSFGSAGRAPRRVAVSPSGGFHVVDAKTGDIVSMTPSGSPVGSLNVPRRMLAITSGGAHLYATSIDGGLYAIDPQGGPPRAIPLRDGALRMPSGIAFDAGRGILWIAEGGAAQLRGVRLDGSTAATIASAGGSALAGLDDVAVDAAGGVLWASVSSNQLGNNVFAFDLSSGAYLYSAVPFGSGDGQVTRTGGIAVDGSGRLFVSDLFQGRVAVYRRDGAALGTLGQFGAGPRRLQLPAGLAVAQDGGVLVASMDQGRVKRFGTGNPVPAPTCTVSGSLDSDCDGMPDWWEVKYGLNPHWAGDALLDADGDGLTNLQEFANGTDPRVPARSPGSTPVDPAPAWTVSPSKLSDPGLVRFSASLASPVPCAVSWKQRLGPQVLLRGGDTLTPSFVGRIAGRYQFQGIATCGAASAAAVVEAVVRNVAPRADAGRLLVVRPGAAIVLDGRFTSDGNGDALELAWDQTIGEPLTGPAPGPTLALRFRTPGYFAFGLGATDASRANDTAEAPVMVVGGSEETPTVVVTSPLAGSVGSPVVLDAGASLEPAGTATYSWSQLDGSPVSLTGANGPTASFTPALAGRYVFQVTLASQSRRSPPARVEVYVGPRGALPVAVASGAAASSVGEPLRLDGSGSVAAGGGELLYAWRQVSGPAAGLTDADRAQATVVPFAPGAYVFELAVKESGVPGVPARLAFVATSAAPGQGLPVATATGPGAAVTGRPLTLDGTASRDPDGHALRHRWTQVAGPWVALDDPFSAAPSFSPRRPGRYVFELEVDDGRIRSAPASVTVMVLPGEAR